MGLSHLFLESWAVHSDVLSQECPRHMPGLLYCGELHTHLLHWAVQWLDQLAVIWDTFSQTFREP